MRALLLLLAAPVIVPAQIPRIGVLDFYGVRKVGEERIRKTAGVHEGDRLPGSKAAIEDRIEKIPGILAARLEAVCCTDQQAIVYIGVEERDSSHFEFRPLPTGTETLPAELLDTYRTFLRVFEEGVRAGNTGEDLSQGHRLSENPAARSYQEQFVALADENLSTLRQVLLGAEDAEQRAAAAYLIGYASGKALVVNDLQLAMQDADESVRANAMQSLGAIAVYGQSHPDSEIRVQPTWFIELLNSIVWSDRLRAAKALVILTDRRDPRMLAALRERALPALVEMAQWKTLTHALPAFILTGRVGGMPETEIHNAWSAGNRMIVIKRALGKGRSSK